MGQDPRARDRSGPAASDTPHGVTPGEFTPPGQTQPGPPITPERWLQVADVFEHALTLAPDERPRYLDQACGSDSELRREVESLLARDGGADGFLDEPRWSLTSMAAGRRIGAYEVQRLVGAGGMGAVYLCARADDQYRQQVAIKLLQPGMATPGLIRRFRAERQILASLEHPNIARLLDGGLTPDGQPYFVMEYVAGEPIDRFCDRSGASIRQRLDVFRQVCDAVAAAHRALVVHRDIKPGNILVQADGTPKLLDFGIAKVLNDDPDAEPVERTITGLRLMTPEYASPEQIRGERITTATDIYSLGVVLYRLLTGAHPHRTPTGSIADTERAICDVDPAPPSRATAGRIDADLSAIVMKALRKEPAERYASVEQLDADLLRYQQGYPVAARRGNTTYHVLKFLRRHRAAAAAGVLLVLSLAAGIAATTWQASVARAERRETEAQRELAERRFTEIRKLANTFVFEFDEAIADLAGATAARQLIVRTALEYLTALAKDARGDTKLQTELATAYQHVGDIQGHPFFPNLGDRPGALRSYREALAIWDAVASTDPANADARIQTAFVRRIIGDVLAEEERHQEALAEYTGAFDVLERTTTGLSATYADAVRGERIGLMARIGSEMASTGQVDDGVRWSERAVREGRASVASGADDEGVHDLTVLYSRAGRTLLAAGAADAAAAMHREEIAACEILVGRAAPERSAHYRRDLALALRNAAAVLVARREIAGALALYERSRDIQTELLRLDAASSQMRKELGTTYRHIGDMLIRRRDLAGAERALAQELRLSARLLQDDQASRLYRVTFADGLRRMGDLLRLRGRRADARRHFLEQAQVLEPLAKPADPDVQRQLLAGFRALGELERDDAAAAAYLHRALEIARTLGDDGAGADVRRLLAARSAAQAPPAKGTSQP